MASRYHARVVDDERGAILVMFAILLVVLIALVAFGVDLGLWLTARTEAQRTADGSALGGAASLITLPGDEDRARQWAKDYAALNPVRKGQITLRDQDIDVLLDEQKVRVRVLRTQEYGGPISTFFARIVGLDEVDVATVAAAEASILGAGAECALPVAIPYPWLNDGPAGEESLQYDEGDSLESPYPAEGEAVACLDGSSSCTALWWGREIVLKPSQGGEGETTTDDESSRLEPGMWDLWLPEAFSGVPPIEDRIRGCVDGDPPIYTCPGELCMWRESGNKQAVARTFEELIDQYHADYGGDHQWVWHPDGPSAGGWLVGTDESGTYHGSMNDPLLSSPIYRPVPVLDPRTYVHQGSGPHISVIDIVGVFLTGYSPIGAPGRRNIFATIVPWQGVPGGDSSGGPTVKFLRLVE